MVACLKPHELLQAAQGVLSKHRPQSPEAGVASSSPAPSPSSASASASAQGVVALLRKSLRAEWHSEKVGPLARRLEDLLRQWGPELLLGLCSRADKVGLQSPHATEASSGRRVFIRGGLEMT